MSEWVTAWETIFLAVFFLAVFFLVVLFLVAVRMPLDAAQEARLGPSA